jgi:hypothetical protein
MREDRSLGCSELSRYGLVLSSMAAVFAIAWKLPIQLILLVLFCRWLTMAQITASSFGEKSLSLEHWQMVKELERLRKQRMQ